MSASDGKSPADFLKAIKGKTVLVKLNSGVDYRGARRRATMKEEEEEEEEDGRMFDSRRDD